MDLSNVHRLRVFAEAAQTLSFVRAAERLRVSQPAVSRQIREIEEIIGVPLFDRIGHGVALTEAGEALLHYAQAVSQMVEEMETVMDRMGKSVAGHLKLAASPIWEYLLPDLIVGFKRAHPDAILALSVAATKQVTELVERNEVQVGFIGHVPEADDLEIIRIMDEEPVIIAAPGHELAQGHCLRPEEVKGTLHFVHRLGNPYGGQPGSGYLGSLGLRGVAIMELESFEAIKRAVRSGIGVGMVPKHAVADELRRGDLVQVALATSPRKWPLHAVRNRARPLSRLQEAFLTFVVQALRPEPQAEDAESPTYKGSSAIGAVD